MTELYPRYLQGRNRTGSDATGTKTHAILHGGFGNFGSKALCGAAPGRLSGGWSEDDDSHITCRRCLSRVSKIGIGTFHKCKGCVNLISDGNYCSRCYTRAAHSIGKAMRILWDAANEI